MKKISALFTAVILMLCLVSCGNNAEAPDGMKVLESSDNLTYNMYIPEKWTQNLSTGVVSAYAGENDLSNISMTTYSVDDYSQSLSDIVANYNEELKNTFNDVEFETEEPENILLGGIAALKTVYSASLTGSTYKYMQIFTARNGNLYIFTYTSQADAFENNMEDVNLILDNFSFR